MIKAYNELFGSTKMKALRYRQVITFLLVGSFFLAGAVSSPRNLNHNVTHEPSSSALYQNSSSADRTVISWARGHEMDFLDRNCPCVVPGCSFPEPLPAKYAVDNGCRLQENPFLGGGLFRLNCLLLI
jgi:hypothetical protein